MQINYYAQQIIKAVIVLMVYMDVVQADICDYCHSEIGCAASYCKFCEC